MKKERILINENSVKSGKELSQLRSLATAINANMIPAIINLGITPTLAMVLDSLHSKREKVEAEYRYLVAEDLKGKRVPAIRERLREEAETPFQEFVKAAEYCQGFIGDRSFLALKDNKCYVSKDNEEAIREKNSYYIEGETIKIHELHMEAVKALNRFR